MAKREGKEWLQSIVEASGVEETRVRAVLESNGIRPMPVSGTPRRLMIREISFSGAKSGITKSGPFEFSWNKLDRGLWALLSDGNFKGKTSVLEITRWLLRGRRPDILLDVQSWIHTAKLHFSLDETHYELSLDLGNGTAGHLSKMNPSGSKKLASFATDSEFESVMSGFFLRELNLDTVARFQRSDESGTSVSHSWPSLSGVMFIGTDYNVLLGDIPPVAGLSVPLMQMYLGLPWVSTLTAAKTAEHAAKQKAEVRDRQHKSMQAERERRKADIEVEIQTAEQSLAAMPSDKDIRQELARLREQYGRDTKAVQETAVQLQHAAVELGEASAAYAADRADLQAFLDGEAAGAVFRMLDPSCCPRCDTAVTNERRARERREHSCSICGETISTNEDSQIEKEILEGRVRASKQARDRVEDRRDSLKNSLLAAEQDLQVLNDRIGELAERMTQFDARTQLETQLAVLRGRLAEVQMDPSVGQSAESEDLKILRVIVTQTEKLVKAAQDGLLSAVSERLTDYAQRFGLSNLTKATLRGNASLPLTKGGKDTSYSQCTKGEKLRLKIAAVLALVQVGEHLGYGRHPGLLMIDSPAAQEVCQEDLEQIMDGLSKVVKEFQHLQIFISSRHSPAISKCMPDGNTRSAHGDETLW